MIKSLINIFQCMSFIINWSIQSYLFLSSTIFWAVPIQLYFHGPSWDFMGVHMGFWAGQSNDYICQFISHSTTSNFWSLNPVNILECEQMILNRIDGWVLLMHTAGLSLLLLCLFLLLLAKSSGL